MKKLILNSIIVVGGILFILLISTIIVTKFKPLYSYSIDKFDIEKRILISKDEMIENYDYVIDYLFNNEKEFKLPTLTYSEDGAFHFYEVKNLFTLAKYISLLLFLVLAIAIYIYFKLFKDHNYLKYLGSSLIIAPIFVGLIISINFNYFFTIFHKIFFNNDKWIFDPNLDPIINILPEEFFALCGGSIVVITILCGIGLLGINKILKIKNL